VILLDPEARPLIGHRGASGEYPENTLWAFDRALEEGADALELDVRLSADGVPVVIHDATLDRTTDGAGPVRDLSLVALRTLDAGAGERVPTLEEVLDRYPATPLILEVKAAEAGEPVARLLHSQGASGRVLVGSFEAAALRPFGAEPFVRAASRGETAWFWIASRLRQAPLRSGYRAFTVPEYHRRLHVVDSSFVTAARRRGLPVHVWTVNEVATARRLRGLGVSGVITDFPARLRAAA
jgi:glycerophosphoryl diester phosphodiesterase